MRIGVLEWASCGGAAPADLSDSIRQEGWAMCRAVIESLYTAGHHPVACLAPGLRKTCFLNRPHNQQSLTALSLTGQTLVDLDPTLAPRLQWQPVYGSCEVTLVIAPESDGVLLDLEAWCQAASIRTGSCDAEFIRQASDKWLTAQRLREHQLPHPATQLLSQWSAADAQHQPTDTWVLKARDGAGCDGMQRIDTAKLESIQSRIQRGDEWIVQPWLQGHAYSRAAIVDTTGMCHWLPVVRQDLWFGESVSFAGGCVLPDLVLTRSQASILQQAIGALAGRARGWIGIDFLLDEDGRLVVIEINPRLTTSFVGLSQACSSSLAEKIVQAAMGFEISWPVDWQRVEFAAK